MTKINFKHQTLLNAELVGLPRSQGIEASPVLKSRQAWVDLSGVRVGLQPTLVVSYVTLLHLTDFIHSYG